MTTIEARNSRMEEPLKVLVPFYHRKGTSPTPVEMISTQVGYKNLTSLVESAGLMPTLIFDGMTDPMIRKLRSEVSAVYLPAGSDINPKRYGQEPHPQWKEGKDLDRDPLEIDIAAWAMEEGVPVLGNCRGAQVLAVAAGGKLIQHIPDLSDEHHGYEGEGPDPIYPSTYSHLIRTVPGTIIYDLYDEEVPSVPSKHHQSIEAPDPTADEQPRFVVSAWSPGGNIVEAIELPRHKHPFAVGVQPHFEFGPEGDLLFSALGVAARNYAASR